MQMIGSSYVERVLATGAVPLNPRDFPRTRHVVGSAKSVERIGELGVGLRRKDAAVAKGSRRLCHLGAASGQRDDRNWDPSSLFLDVCL